MMRTPVAIALGLSVVSGCTASSSLPAPAGVAIPAVPTPTERPVARPRFTIREERAVYTVVANVVTMEIGAEASHDSLQLTEEIRVEITPESTPGLYRLRMFSDSGMQGERTRTSLNERQPPTLEALLDSTALTFSVAGLNQLVPCRAYPTLLSPLFLQLMLEATLRETDAPSTAPETTITFQGCRGGTAIKSTLELATSNPQLQPGGPFQQFALKGTLSADSTKHFPMYLTGSLAGNAEVAPLADATILPRQLTLYLSADIRSANAIKQQRFRQETTTLLTRR